MLAETVSRRRCDLLRTLAIKWIFYPLRSRPRGFIPKPNRLGAPGSAAPNFGPPRPEPAACDHHAIRGPAPLSGWIEIGASAEPSRFQRRRCGLTGSRQGSRPSRKPSILVMTGTRARQARRGRQQPYCVVPRLGFECDPRGQGHPAASSATSPVKTARQRGSWN